MSTRTLQLCLSDQAGAERLQASVYRFLEQKTAESGDGELFTAMSLTPSSVGYTAEVRFEHVALAREFERLWRSCS